MNFTLWPYEQPPLSPYLKPLADLHRCRSDAQKTYFVWRNLNWIGIKVHIFLLVKCTSRNKCKKCLPDFPHLGLPSTTTLIRFTVIFIGSFYITIHRVRTKSAYSNCWIEIQYEKIAARSAVSIYSWHTRAPNTRLRATAVQTVRSPRYKQLAQSRPYLMDWEAWIFSSVYICMAFLL